MRKASLAALIAAAIFLSARDASACCWGWWGCGYGCYPACYAYYRPICPVPACYGVYPYYAYPVYGGYAAYPPAGSAYARANPYRYGSPYGYARMNPYLYGTVGTGYARSAQPVETPAARVSPYGSPPASRAGAEARYASYRR